MLVGGLVAAIGNDQFQQMVSLRQAQTVGFGQGHGVQVRQRVRHSETSGKLLSAIIATTRLAPQVGGWSDRGQPCCDRNQVCIPRQVRDPPGGCLTYRHCHSSGNPEPRPWANTAIAQRTRLVDSGRVWFCIRQPYLTTTRSLHSRRGCNNGARAQRGRGKRVRGRNRVASDGEPVVW